MYKELHNVICQMVVLLCIGQTPSSPRRYCNQHLSVIVVDGAERISCIALDLQVELYGISNHHIAVTGE